MNRLAMFVAYALIAAGLVIMPLGILLGTGGHETRAHVTALANTAAQPAMAAKKAKVVAAPPLSTPGSLKTPG